MNDALKEALGQVRAEQSLKEDTLAYLYQQTNGYQHSRHSASYFRPVLSLAACLLVVACLGLWRVWFTPVSVISIDINPSLELELNRFDRVISVEGYNEDGQALAESLSVQFLSYQQALEEILNSETVADCLARQELLSIAVVDDDAQRQQALLAGVQACTSGHGQAHCYAADGSALEEAHHAGLSYGKYQAYLELSALDPEITLQQVQEMTMREIRERIAALSFPSSSLDGSLQEEEDSQFQGSSVQGYGQSSGSGQQGGHHYGQEGGHHYGRSSG